MDEAADRQAVAVESAADTIQRIVSNLATVVHAPADVAALLRRLRRCVADFVVHFASVVRPRSSARSGPGKWKRTGPSGSALRNCLR